jgi:2'-5' RNA ligase
VIFINIEDHEPIKILHIELQKVISANLQLKKHEKFSKIHPHITLASRDLHYKQFSKTWADFKMRDFTDSFTVQSSSLLKHDGKVWHQQRDFPLN